MNRQGVLVLVLVGAASSNVPITQATPAEPTTASPPMRPVTWSRSVAEPKRVDLDSELDKRFVDPWRLFDRKTRQRRDVNTCRQLLSLAATSEPMDVSDDGASPTGLIDNDWNIYVQVLVRCRVVGAVQNAKPARVDYLGGFLLDNARLKDIPAAVIPTPSDWEEKRLKKASSKGVSWKGWDRAIHVTKTIRGDVLVESNDTSCFLGVYARGDFNDDGIEDLVLWRSGGGQEGTWSSTAGFVLTRRSPRGRLEIVKVIE